MTDLISQSEIMLVEHVLEHDFRTRKNHDLRFRVSNKIRNRPAAIGRFVFERHEGFYLVGYEGQGQRLKPSKALSLAHAICSAPFKPVSVLDYFGSADIARKMLKRHQQSDMLPKIRVICPELSKHLDCFIHVFKDGTAVYQPEQNSTEIMTCSAFVPRHSLLEAFPLMYPYRTLLTG